MEAEFVTLDPSIAIQLKFQYKTEMLPDDSFELHSRHCGINDSDEKSPVITVILCHYCF